MSLRRADVRMSSEEYLESEKNQTVRHEYVDGILFFTQPDDAINLASIGLTLMLRDVYRHVRFDSE